MKKGNARVWREEEEEAGRQRLQWVAVGAGDAWEAQEESPEPRKRAMHEAIAGLQPTASATRLLAARFWPEERWPTKWRPHSRLAYPEPDLSGDGGPTAGCWPPAKDRSRRIWQDSGTTLSRRLESTAEMNCDGDAPPVYPTTSTCGCAKFQDNLRTVRHLENDVIMPSG